MKKLFSIVGVVATAVFAFSSCNREQAVNDAPVKEKVTFTFTAEKPGEETRTAAVEGEKGVSYLWTDEDLNNMRLYLVTEGPDGEQATVIDDLTFDISSDNKQMSITAEVDAADSYTFRAVLAGSFSNNGNPKVKASQSPKVDNFDPTADLLVSEDLTVTSPANMLLKFIRKVVVNKMTLKGLTAGEKVKKVIVSSNQYLNGTWTNGQFSYNQPAEKTITLTYPNLEIGSNGQFPVYFTSIPKTGHELTVTVITDAKKYTKTFGGSIAFNQGSFTRFGVTMPEGTIIDNIEGVYYIAAMPTTWKLMNYACTSETGVGYYPSIETNVTSTLANVTGEDFVDANNYQWEVESIEGGYTIKSVHTGLYLACTSDLTDSNYADFKATVDEYTVFNITIDDKLATINSVKYAQRYLRYNSSQPRFTFYRNSTNQPVYLIPAFSDGLTAVTLSFAEATINTNTNDYASITGQTVTANPNVPAITDAITYTLTGDEIGTINASTGAVTLNGTAGTATVTASFPGDATYREATASYDIVVADASKQYYVKVTSALTDWSGEYLFVYEATRVAFNGSLSTLDVANNNVAVTILSGDKIEKTTTTQGYAFTIASVTDGYSIKSASGKYIGRDASSNGLNSADTYSNEYKNTISYSNGVVIKGNGGYQLAFNNSNDQKRFRYYSSANIAAYKLEDNRPQVSTPSISVGSGEVALGTEVTITCSTNGATIYYTTDGSTPTSSSTLYSGVITISEGMTLQAIATKSGMKDSEIASATYTVPTCETPVIAPAAGPVVSGTEVSITCGTQGATIRYTLNGDEPTSSSSAYTEPITITEAVTVKAKAFKEGAVSSATATASYTIKPATEGEGTADDPYTVADIIALYVTAGSSSNVYVTGYVSEVTSYSSQHHNMNYKISDGTNEIIVYRGMNLNNTNFTSINDLAVYDEVVVYGTIAIYNDAPQLAQGNYLISKSAPADAPALTIAPATTSSSPASWASGENDEKTFTITPVNGTWDISEESVSSWANITKDITNNNIKVTPKTNQAASAFSGSIKVTLTPTNNRYDAIDEIIYISQAKYTSGNQSYTIIFGNNASRATAISSTTKASTVISTGTNYVTAQPFTINSGDVYYGDTKTCIRIGKSGKESSLSIELSDTGKVKAKSIVVNCDNTGGNKNSNAKLNVNSIGQQTTTTTASDYTFTYASATDITSINLEGTASIRIYSITVNY